jgi:CubicO group peptidase (beta-lactamase class C family)
MLSASHPSRRRLHHCGRVGGVRRGRSWLRVALAALLVAACSGSDGGAAPATSQPAGLAARDYWPTGGWRSAAPADQGMNPEALAGIDALVTGQGALAGKFRERFPQVRSVLVVRHGYVVYERYWRGDTATSGQDVQSVTKSLTSTLVGIALGNHDLKSLTQTVGELLGRHLPACADPRLAKVTVAQLLTMTGGLARDVPGAGGDPGLSEQMVASRDWVRHILGRRLATAPGTGFAYSNAGAHLLSAIVADVSGQSTLAFARAKLFGPLGIASDGAAEPVIPTTPAAQVQAYEQASVGWPKDRQGYQLGFTGLKLPSRDLAKLGFLYLNGGRWEGNQLVPEAYVRAATQAHTEMGPAEADDYGYLWRVGTVAGHHSFRAWGYGGQLVQVVPDLDLVVVITSAVQPREEAPALVRLVIIPAITDA